MPIAGRALAWLAALPCSSSILIKPEHHEFPETCAPLRDHETYSSVKVMVGTPPQNFDLVADTGSNNCIVKSCACNSCPRDWGKCFVGTNRSKSFHLPNFALNKKGEPIGHSKEVASEGPATTVLSFGSGQIAAKIASDEVRVGALKTYMKNGVLLMVDHALNLGGPFEGILGLGRPEFKEAEEETAPVIKVPGFLESAHVRRFSMCFNREADGVLGINTPAHTGALRSVGKMHWGLDFRGISIGEKEVQVGICDPSTKAPGMETACGLIPDSGTTLIAASEKQLAKLYEVLCSQWQRCQRAHKHLQQEVEKLQKDGVSIEPRGALGWNLAEDGSSKANSTGSPRFGVGKRHDAMLTMTGRATKSDALGQPSGELPKGLSLQLLLESCADWIQGVDLEKELPELHFHVADTTGKKDKLSLKPGSYILRRDMEVETPSVSELFGYPIRTVKKQQRQVCMMAFSPIEYKTQLNGDVWIMGTPLFYEYTAHYDRGNGKEEEVTMGFTRRDQQACGQCSGHKVVRPSATLISQERQRSESSSLGLHTLKKLTQKPRVMNITSLESI